MSNGTLNHPDKNPLDHNNPKHNQYSANARIKFPFEAWYTRYPCVYVDSGKLSTFLEV